MTNCPEGEFRSKLSEEDFWNHVYKSLQEAYDPVDDGTFIDDIAILMSQPCTICGEVGACGYDAEGRPMIHSLSEEESDEE